MSEPSTPASGHCRPVRRGEYTSTSFPAVGEVIILPVDTTRSIINSVPSSDIMITESSKVTTSSEIQSESERSKFQPHPCIVTSVTRTPTSSTQNRWFVEVLVVRSYKYLNNYAVNHVSNLPDLVHAMHLPLSPPGSLPALPTPVSFGSPVETSYVPRSYSWIIAEILDLEMGRNGWVRSESVLKIVGIDSLHDYLVSAFRTSDSTLKD